MWSRIAKIFSGNRRSTLAGPEHETAPLTSSALGDRTEDHRQALDDPTGTPLGHHGQPDLTEKRPEDKELDGDLPTSSVEQAAPWVQQAAERNDSDHHEDFSARWTAADRRPLVYAHKLRLDRSEFSGPAKTLEEVSRRDDKPRASAVFPIAPAQEDGDAGSRFSRNEAAAPATAFASGPIAENLGSRFERQVAEDGWNDSAALSELYQPSAPVISENLSVADESAWQTSAVTQDSHPAVQTLRDTRELAVDAPPHTTGRFSMLRAVANQWQIGLEACDYLFVVGSAAEGRRMAPVIRALKTTTRDSQRVVICVAGDHPARTRESLSLLGIEADLELSAPAYNESLEETRTRMIKGFGKIFSELKPRWVVVQGEGTTAAMAAMAAYYTQTQVAHIEGAAFSLDFAEGDESNPEVLHHLIANLFATVHFAETSWSKEALIRNGVPAESILVTGKTSVDVTYETCVALGLPIGATAVRTSGVVRVLVIAESPNTIAHHLPSLCQAIRNLARSVPGLYKFSWPLHGDVRGAQIVNELLDRVPGVLLSGPSTYEHFLRQLSECDMVLTDVEDIQEEAPSFGKPVLLIGDEAHRPEASRAGITTLVEADAASIQAGIRTLARKLSVRHGSITNPYGDGKAAVRILDFFQGRQVLEFGRSALPRLSATGQSQSLRQLGTSSSVN